MNVKHVYDEGLCMQCGTCEGVCPAGAVALAWDLRVGYRLSVQAQTCTDCGRCHEACPGPGLDFSPDAWLRERNEDAPSEDFLGPWRGLAFGWAADETVRHKGSSGGAAKALVRVALETGAVDAVIAVRMSAANPLEAEGAICRTPEEVAACRGSKYNVVALNTTLRQVPEEPGRYALVGLPCHIQGCAWRSAGPGGSASAWCSRWASSVGSLVSPARPPWRRDRRASIPRSSASSRTEGRGGRGACAWRRTVAWSACGTTPTTGTATWRP